MNRIINKFDIKIKELQMRSQSKKQIFQSDSRVLSIEKFMRISNAAYVQGIIPPNRKSSVLEVHPFHKLVYHCYKRFKTFTYNLDQVYDESEGSGFFNNASKQEGSCPTDMINSFDISSIKKSIEQNINYMMYCQGFIPPEVQQLDSNFPKQLRIIYEMLNHLIATLVKQKQTYLNLYAFAISQDCIVDLISEKTIKQVREKHLKNGIDFYGAQSTKIETEYELYAALVQTFKKKNKIIINSYYVVYLQFVPNQNTNTQQNLTKSILFVDAVKRGHEKTHWDSNTQLVLGKCLTGLINRMQKPFDGKQSYAPFRDSKLTRVMKPFLWQNSKVELLTFLDRNDEEATYQNLNFSKIFSKIKIPIKSFPEVKPEFILKIKDLQKDNKELKSRLETIQPPPISQLKRNFFAELKQLDDSEQNLKMQCRKNEVLIKILKNRAVNKRIFKLPLLQQDTPKKSNPQTMEIFEQKQIEHKEKQQEELYRKLEQINEQRISTIGKVSTKTQKLKLMKQYYLRSLQFQKEEIEKNLEYQKEVQKSFKSYIKQIEDNLKKSPKQLLHDQFLTPQKSKTITRKSQGEPLRSKKLKTQQTKMSQDATLLSKKNSTAGVRKKTLFENPENGQPALPYLSLKQRQNNKRKRFIKAKAEKGRVQYESYLTKNIQQYQSYISPKKKLER